MAKIHIQTAHNKIYQVVVHTSMPAGNNTHGKSWQDCWVATGRNTTVMTEGTGTGQISTAEKAAVEAGTTLEFVFSMPVESGGATVASLDQMVDQAVVDRKAALQAELKRYGYTQG